MIRADSDHPDPDHPDPEDTDPEDADPGLFRERTELAWHRTGIAFAALGGAVLKTAPVVGLLILAGSAPIFVLAHVSRPGRRADGPGRRRPLLLIAIAVTAVALVAMVLAFFAGDHPRPPF
jgi:uncharacterized membrane protein YidH (DUF202 family)